MLGYPQFPPRPPGVPIAPARINPMMQRPGIMPPMRQPLPMQPFQLGRMGGREGEPITQPQASCGQQPSQYQRLAQMLNRGR